MAAVVAACGANAGAYSPRIAMAVISQVA